MPRVKVRYRAIVFRCHPTTHRTRAAGIRPFILPQRPPRRPPPPAADRRTLELGRMACEPSPSRRILRRREKSEHYGDAEFLDRQWRLLDLVPRRWIALGGLLTAGGGNDRGSGGRLRPDARARGGRRDAGGRACRSTPKAAWPAGSRRWCCWRHRSPRCWSTAFAGTGPTITAGDTACGSGPPAAGS